MFFRPSLHLPAARTLILVLLLGWVMHLHASAADEAATPEPRAIQVADGVFIGVVPRGRSPADVVDGLSVVIDLRYAYEGVYDELGELRDRGITHVNIPTSSHGPQEKQVLALEQALREHPGATVLIHDSNGSRAAMLWAAHRIQAGADLDAALAEVSELYPADELRPKLEPFRDRVMALEANAERDHEAPAAGSGAPPR